MILGLVGRVAAGVVVALVLHQVLTSAVPAERRTWRRWQLVLIAVALAGWLPQATSLASPARQLRAQPLPAHGPRPTPVGAERVIGKDVRHLIDGAADDPAPVVKPGEVFHLTEANFGALVKHSKLPILVDVHAPWCESCRRLDPHVAKVAARLKGKLTVAELNVDQCQALETKIGVVGLPALHVIVDGKIADSWLGAKDATEIITRVKPRLH